MRILIVKTSSLGDVIHNLPVLSDIRRHFPDAEIDWCVEESFSAIPRLHPGVGTIIPVAIRRWRKNLLKAATWREIAEFRRLLQVCAYDAVVDTQGLLKSALIASQATGPVLGYAADSAREPLAARCYDRRFHVSRELHAVLRNLRLAGAALGYTAASEPDYGIEAHAAGFDWLPHRPYVVFLTATSRDDKLWPEANWLALGQRLNSLGLSAVLPGGSVVERERASRLAAGIPGAVAAPSMNIPDLASLLAGARAAVGVDTGLTHLAVALKVPTVALYTATDPGLTGVLGAGFYRNLGGQDQNPSPDAVLGELQVALG
ncbi:lipopolysaccharide heptosyltransferase I [Ferribacterium limneticum]|uniref:lipopolysaccharide heptosyltransferase I n=1 Tax=Ferribacterium limneticum TaxID=76259 RepID=UPI001CFADDB6|nr:lipopolysaccharide heptosyltransferase I [Ferribacterium limneticum]UCV28248.1 lipopolysaccharide heptosyltransferase I [Ferribacterium limneticum]UCV32165.1 lipopolysaccharide heptosyltransferase I [Ferribacterium limneticum]